ncbi:hypothetical protein IC619_015185 [Hazenella sp. IB182353]|uniref:sigma factor-like helix-turn-helix DNA-binding protein n=1 Tax=Polycladospora coralii TaxID=2771432 RepID=UPI0017466119|nr:sigma factor-like helix-turn-helix DNA-binding protein [Polycladospora coralii]MBS7531815.1 hypothetical protein [Polycladospora coralii]
MENLMKEYQTSLKHIQQAIDRLSNKEYPSKKDPKDIQLLRGMERDLKWAMEWMKCRSQPKKRRGIERYAGYQREIFWSRLSAKQQREIEWRENQVMLSNSSSHENPQLRLILDQLSRSEYESFVAVRGEGISFAQVASLLKCSKSTIQSYVHRAEQKINILKEL